MTEDTLRFTNSDTNSDTIPDEPSDNGQPTTDNPCFGANPQSLDPNPSPFPADNGEPTTENVSSPGPTGPRTPEGKARSAQNALKLGLSIQRHVLLPHEDPAEYAELRDSILAIYEPQSARETLAVDDISQCRWAFRRFDEAELMAIEKATRPFFADPKYPYSYGEALGGLAEPQKFEPGRYDPMLDQKPRPMLDIPLWPGLNNLQRYRTWWERRHQRAIAEFERACKARRQDARDRERQEWHEARMAREERRKQRDLRRQQQEEATDRRREARHADLMARGQADLRLRQAMLATLRPEEFVSQNPATPANPTPPAAGNRHPSPQNLNQ
ncbi:MAG: hypothetical protein KIT83_00625 [Bryobacterales bacterium]|nr:hypothetical protein [Bryobacterales bacterium]